MAQAASGPGPARMRKAANRPCLALAIRSDARARRRAPSMRIRLPILAPMLAPVLMVLAGGCSQAGAQAPCPELIRLRGEVAETSGKLRGVATPDRCAAYVRHSMAWGAMVRYAGEHREMCDVSSVAF